MKNSDLAKDIQTFKSTFADKLPDGKWLGTDVNFDCVYEYQEAGIYKVYNTDDYGRDFGVIGYVRAASREHARLLLSIERSNAEIFLTGFYGSWIVSADEINDRIESLESELAKLKRVQNL